MQNSESPSGRFLITISALEMRMSLWVETPSISDTGSGEQLLAFKDSHWSLDSAQWLGDSVVALNLRKYPGNHVPAQIIATVDCEARTAEVDGKRVEDLAQLEQTLDAALEWVQVVVPPPPAPGGIGGFIRRLFGR